MSTLKTNVRHSKRCREDKSSWAYKHLPVAIPAPIGKADSLTWMKQTNLAPAKMFAMTQLLRIKVLPRTGYQVALSLHIHPSEAEERHFTLGKIVSVIFWRQNRSSSKISLPHQQLVGLGAKHAKERSSAGCQSPLSFHLEFRIPHLPSEDILNKFYRVQLHSIREL